MSPHSAEREKTHYIYTPYEYTGEKEKMAMGHARFAAGIIMLPTANSSTTNDPEITTMNEGGERMEALSPLSEEITTSPMRERPFLPVHSIFSLLLFFLHFIKLTNDALQDEEEQGLFSFSLHIIPI